MIDDVHDRGIADRHRHIRATADPRTLTILPKDRHGPLRRTDTVNATDMDPKDPKVANSNALSVRDNKRTHGK